MRKNLNYIYIIFIFIFSLFLSSNNVKAVVTCEANRKSDYEVKFHIYDTGDTEHDGAYITLKLDSATNKISTLNICGKSIISNGNNVSSYDLTSQKYYLCDVPGSQSYNISFPSVNLTGKFYKLTNNVICGIFNSSYVNITGLKNASEGTTSDSVFCSGDFYNFVVRQGQDNEAQCNVTIQQDTPDGDVIMKHGGKTTTNPKAGKYVCETPMGDYIEFYLSKDLNKGSLKTSSDCPELKNSFGADGTQAEIGTPTGVTKPTNKPSDTTTTTTQPSKQSKIIMLNLDYDGICGNEGVQKAVKILGTIINLLKFIAPMLIIVLGIIDYVKAVTSDDENALSKATESLIKRLVSGIVIFFIPTLLWGILNILDITDGIHDLDNTEFGTCTKCLLKNKCN